MKDWIKNKSQRAYIAAVAGGKRVGGVFKQAGIFTAMCATAVVGFASDLMAQAWEMPTGAKVDDVATAAGTELATALPTIITLVIGVSIILAIIRFVMRTPKKAARGG